MEYVNPTSDDRVCSHVLRGQGSGGVGSHVYGMALGKAKLHIPLGLPYLKAVQVSL